VEEGTLVFRGQDRATLLTTVTALDRIKFVFEMDERSYLDYQRLLREKKVKGVGGSLGLRLPGEDVFAHEGTLENIEDQVGPNGTVRVHGSYSNSGLLRPGMSVGVRITLGPPRAVLEIPETALLSDQGKKYVFVVDEKNIVQRREVVPGPSDKDMRIIEKGLHAEDWVVIGVAGIRPGDSIEPRRKPLPTPLDSGRDRSP